ncbi:uncharacterized protein LOC117793852 [Drosophila innubila]|uniref:uncharacterized protein LOC117793852 n=1 Tax=Drosophila innubila TaxID=198719 RepID=UPI00148B4B23|nr:uncharacterized protein LOC117793852 [Drosophila innubila]
MKSCPTRAIRLEKSAVPSIVSCAALDILISTDSDNNRRTKASGIISPATEGISWHRRGKTLESSIGIHSSKRIAARCDIVQLMETPHGFASIPGPQFTQSITCR